MMHKVPYGKEELAFELPPGMRGTVVESRKVLPSADVEADIADALAKPVNSLPLPELAKPGDTVCIVFTDITRASPDYLLVLPLLVELEAAGVRQQIKIMIGGAPVTQDYAD